MNAVMTDRVNDERALRRVLWADTALGSLTGFVGLVFAARLSPLLGLPPDLIVAVSLITSVYGVAAFVWAARTSVAVPFVKVLVGANGLWTAVSVVLLVMYAAATTVLGLAFLVLQTLVVGGLAFLKGRQLVK